MQHLCKIKNLESRLQIRTAAVPRSVASVIAGSSPPQEAEPARLLSPWAPPGKSTGVASHSLLQGTLLTQDSDPCLLHFRWILYQWATRETPVRVQVTPNRKAVWKYLSKLQMYIVLDTQFHFQEFILQIYLCMHVRLSHFSHVRLYETPWSHSSPRGSSVHGILQARILEWVAMPSSRGSSWPRD